MLSFLLTPFHIWDWYYFESHLSLAFCIKVLLIKKHVTFFVVFVTWKITFSHEFIFMFISYFIGVDIVGKKKIRSGVDGEKIKSGDGGIEVGYRRRVGVGIQTFLHTKYLIKVNNWNSWIMCEICSKLTIVSSVFIVNFEQLSHIVLLLKTPLFREKFTCGQIPVQNSNIDIRITFIGCFLLFLS